MSWKFVHNTITYFGLRTIFLGGDGGSTFRVIEKDPKSYHYCLFRQFFFILSYNRIRKREQIVMGHKCN